MTGRTSDKMRSGETTQIEPSVSRFAVYVVQEKGAMREDLRGNRNTDWGDGHIAGVGRVCGRAGGICAGRGVVMTTRRLPLVVVGISLMVIRDGNCTPVIKVSGQDVLDSRYLHFLGSMVVLCKSRDSDSAGHKVSRRNRGLGRGNVRGLGRLNRVRHSGDGRHSGSGRHGSSGRYGRSGHHCRDPKTRVSSEHMDLLWEHLRCDSLGRCRDADNSRSLPHSRWMMARWMMARGGRRVVLVPFGAWMTMLACTIVPTCENALRSKDH